MYKIEFREYLCHPETCCHENHKSWWITLNGNWYQGFETRKEAEIELAKLN